MRTDNDMQSKQEEQEPNSYRNKEVSVAQRQIYILSFLSENPKGYQAEEIRERLKNWDIEVSKRTIMRDIDELSLNYGIGEDERNGKTYFFADKYTLKNVDLTIEDLASLAFAKEMLAEYKHLDMGKHAITLIDKMVEGSASLNRLQFDKLCGHFKQAGKKSGNQDVVDIRIERILQNAIDSRNKVTITYYSFSSNESTVRTIHPYRMLMIDTYLCVEGYCELRKEIRRFRLSRIQEAEQLDVKFEQKEPEQTQTKDAFLKLAGGEEEELELLFTGESIRYVKEYEAERARRIKETDEGLVFYQKTAMAPDVIRWIRGFGTEVTVRKPEWLAEQLKKEAGEQLKKYQ